MNNLVVVKTFMYRHEAEIAQAFLSGHDIESVVQADDCAGMRHHLSFVQDGVKLLVRESDLEAAQKALES